MGISTLSYEEEWDKSLILELNQRIDQDSPEATAKEYDEIMQQDILHTELGDTYVKMLTKIMRNESSHQCIFCKGPAREKTVICEDCWKENEEIKVPLDQRALVNCIVSKTQPPERVTPIGLATKERKNKRWILYIGGLLACFLIAFFIHKLMQRPVFIADFASDKFFEERFLLQYEKILESQCRPMIGETMDISFEYEDNSLGGNAYTLVVNGTPIRAGVILFCRGDSTVGAVMVYATQSGRYMYLMEQCLVKLTDSKLKTEEIDTMLETTGSYESPAMCGENYMYLKDDNEMILSASDFYSTMQSQMQQALTSY